MRNMGSVAADYSDKLILGHSSRYRPEIDGLRAVSVVSVLLFHLEVGGFGGGYVGVDVFFVISGYLIVRYIIAEIEAGTFQFSKFYQRRIRRLFPALFVTVAVSTVFAVLLLSPDDLRDFARNVITTFGAISNIVLWRDSISYFAPNVKYLPLLHTWSLSVEEQFYLVCPAALVIVARLGGGKPIFVVALIAAGVFSLVACQYQLATHPSAVYYLAPFRVFEFCIGALCIEVERRLATPAMVGEAISAVGGLALALSITFLTKDTPFPGAWALVPCLGAAAVICTDRHTVVGRLLASPFAVGVGLISYSLYLCHWPILVFARIAFGEISAPAWKAVIVAASFAVAVILFVFVETPFRRRKGPRGSSSFVRLAVKCAVLTICVAGPSWLVVLQNGWPWRLNAEQLARREQHRYGPTACIADSRTECAFGAPDGPLGLLLIGDSHMKHLIAAFDATLRARGRRGESYAVQACSMLIGLQRTDGYGTIDADCRLARDRFFTLALATEKVAPLVISQEWVWSDLADDTGRPIVAPTADTRMRLWQDALERTISLLGAGGRRILVVGPSVALPCQVDRRILQIGPFSHPLTSDCSAITGIEAHKKYLPIRNMLLAVQRAHSDQVTLLFPEDYLCDEICYVAVDGVQLYFDNTHLTVAGAAYIGAHASDLITRFLAGKQRTPDFGSYN
jgi:peptidoglycan/LPS O-acetylase OafA/YrhL